MKKTKTKKEFNSGLFGNNNGSTLITVVIAISFVTILTAIILSTSVMNYRMKAVDRHAKDNFYYAEKALNDIYNGIGQETQIISAQKYDAYFKKPGDSYAEVKLAESNYRKAFLSEVMTNYTNLPTNPSGIDRFIVTKDVTNKIASVKVNSVNEIKYQKKDGVTDVTDAADADRVKIGGVEIWSTDTEGNTSIISTDIIINCPSTDFLGANVDVTDYGLIAGKGLYINGSDPVKIEGNVFAGIHAEDSSSTEKDDYGMGDLIGGINIKDAKVTFEGNNIVSKGDINLSGNDPSCTIGIPGATGDANLPNVWFNSFRITNKASGNPKLDANANLFALNDLEVNADKTTIELGGNYYGYNDKALPSGEKSIEGMASSDREDSDSSAIIVNGNKADIDLSGLKSLVLMGRAYIDFTGDGHTAYDDKVVATAESLALKTNQQLYLVPPDFIDGANPIASSSPITSPFTIVSKSSASEWTDWFGFKYIKSEKQKDNAGNEVTDSTGANIYIPSIKKEQVGLSGSSDYIYYAFLDFDDNKTWESDGSGGFVPALETDGVTYKQVDSQNVLSSRAAFFAEVIAAGDTGAAPTAKTLRNRIRYSLNNADYFDLAECIIDTTLPSGSVQKPILYARNAVVSYDSALTNIHILSNDVGMERYASYPTNLFNRYRWLCTTLDAKSDIPIAASSSELDFTTSNGAPTGEWVIDPTNGEPLNHFVNLSGIPATYDSTLSDKADKDGLYRSAFGECLAITGNLTIGNDHCYIGTSDIGDYVDGGVFKGIAIVKGNIVLETGVDVNGLLMATGTITLKGNNEIRNDKGLIQARIEKEIELVREYDGTGDGYSDCYLIKHLTDGSTTAKLYDVAKGSKKKEERIDADYNDYMHYENWQKGPR